MSKRKLDHDDAISPDLPIILKLIKPEDEEILYYACRSLNLLLEAKSESDDDGKKERIQTLDADDICSRLVQLVFHPSNRVAIAAVNIVGYIADKDDEKSIKAIVDAGIASRLVYHLEHSQDDIKSAAVWAISRCIKGCPNEQLRHLVAKGCIPAFCQMLIAFEVETVLHFLDLLQYILQVGEEMSKQDGVPSPYPKVLEECGGFEKIKVLQLDTSNTEIPKQAAYIIHSYFINIF